MKRIIGLLLSGSAGALVGLLYYKFIGCSGGCAITSSPWRSAIYMGIIGILVFLSFRGNKANN